MIRFIQTNDLPRIVEIYNQAVTKKFQTADLRPVTVETHTGWLNAHKEDRYPVLIYEVDNAIVGWLSISPYRPGREALRSCVEISYYLDDAFQGIGIGNELVRHALLTCKRLGYKSVFAIILDRNMASINLMKKNGFEQWAYMPGIAEFDGEPCGHVYYGIKI